MLECVLSAFLKALIIPPLLAILACSGVVLVNGIICFLYGFFLSFTNSFDVAIAISNISLCLVDIVVDIVFRWIVANKGIEFWVTAKGLEVGSAHDEGKGDRCNPECQND